MRRAGIALLALLILCAPAKAQQDLWWLAGAFDLVETDGYQRVGGVLEYEKIAVSGEATLYAVGYPAQSGYTLTYPACEEGEPVALGAFEARRWRYLGDESGEEGAGEVLWDYLALEAGEMIFSVMISSPQDSQDAQALIGSLCLQAQPQDDAPMPALETAGLDLAMDQLLDGDHRVMAWTLGEELSLTLLRAPSTLSPFSSLAQMREAFVFDGEDDHNARQLDPPTFDDATAELWQFDLAMDNGETCATRALLLRRKQWSYVLMAGLTGEGTQQALEAIEAAFSSLTFS